MGHLGNSSVLESTMLLICYKLWLKTKSFLCIFSSASAKIAPQQEAACRKLLTLLCSEVPYEVLSLGFCLYQWCVCLELMNIGAQLKGSRAHWSTPASPLADRDTHALICFCFQVTLHPPSHLQQLFSPPPCISSTFSAVLIYWPLRFNASSLGEVSVLVSDLRSPVLLIPGDFNLHMDVTSDTQHRILCYMILSSCVSSFLQGYDFINSLGLIIRVWGHSPIFWYRGTPTVPLGFLST